MEKSDTEKLMESENEYPSSTEQMETTFIHEADFTVLPADTMARKTFIGELEYRDKLRVEINHHMRNELSYVVPLIEAAATNASSWFQYDKNFWSEWLKQAPESVHGGDAELLRKKTCIREEMILRAIGKCLETYGYNYNLTYPYRAPGDKPFLYITWEAKPSSSNCLAAFSRLMITLMFFGLLFCFVVPALIIGFVGGAHYLYSEFGDWLPWGWWS